MTEVVEQKKTKLEVFEERLGEMTDAVKMLDRACLKQILWEHREKPDEDVMAFLRKAQLVGADPRLGEIYLVGYGGRTSVIYNYQFIMNRAAKNVNIDAIEVLCEKREVYDPVKKEDVTDLVATARTYINGKEYKAEAEFNEFYNSKNPTWRSYTKSMLEKCAIVKLCRRIPNSGVSDMMIAEENPIYQANQKPSEVVENNALKNVIMGSAGKKAEDNTFKLNAKT